MKGALSDGVLPQVLRSILVGHRSGRLTLAHGIEIRMLHRNEQPPDLRRVTEGNTPCIVAETDRGYEALVTRADLESCQGDVVCLDRLLQRALATRRPG